MTIVCLPVAPANPVDPLCLPIERPAAGTINDNAFDGAQDPVQQAPSLAAPDDSAEPPVLPVIR